METKQISTKLSNIAIATGMSIFIISINGAILNLLYPMWGLHIGYKQIPSWQSLLSLLVTAPLAEEFIFRWIPFRLLKDTTLFKEKTYYFVAISAIIFGYIHGGFNNIYLQGVAGFFFGWVYIKNEMSYWSAVATHFLYNFMICIIFPLIS